MKKFIQNHLQFVCVCMLVLFSCENKEANPDTGPSIREIHEEGEYHFSVIEADGCEYLMLMMDRNHPHEGFGFMAHKGNCRNPIHLYNPEVPFEVKQYPEGIITGKPLKK